MPIAIEKCINNYVKNNINLLLVRPDERPWITDCFLDLMELVRYSLEDLGYTVTESINEFASCRNIVFGAHLMKPEVCDNAPNDTIVYQMEQLPMFMSAHLKRLMQRVTVWEYSEANYPWLVSNNIRNVKYVPFGYHSGMNRITHETDKEYDFLFYGSENKRRKLVMASWWELGDRVKLVNHGAVGEERDKWIANSKVVVSMHQFQDKVRPIHEMARVYYLMSNRACVLSEVNSDTHIYPWVKEAIVTAPYEDLVAVGHKLAHDTKWREAKALIGWEAIKQHPMKKIVAAAL